MKKNGLVIVAIIVMVSMIIVMVLWLGVRGPIWRAVWVAQPADWLGFFGSVVAGFMTIGAAGIAWLAVSMQIASDRELASRGHLQSMRAVKFMRRPLLESFDLLWKIFEETLAFQGTDEEKLSRTTWLQGMFFATPPQTIVDDLKKAGDGLDSDRALLFESVLLRLSNFYKLMIRYSEQQERSDELKWRMNDIQMMRLQLALLKDAVEKFEPAWGKVFTQHRKVPLDDSSYADVMRSTYKLWVAEEALRRANADH